jgi:hypothetical protein
MVYNNVEKSHEGDTVKETNPQLMYKEVKDELMRFAETAMEKRVRVRNEWKGFVFARDMSVLEFETRFIKLTAQLRGRSSMFS